MQRLQACAPHLDTVGGRKQFQLRTAVQRHDLLVQRAVQAPRIKVVRKIAAVVDP